MILIPGGAGIGKSRTGWETQFLVSHARNRQAVKEWTSPIELEKFLDALSDCLYIHIDFSNGYQYTPDLDERYSPSIRIGARIAVAAGLLKCKFEQLMVYHPVEGLGFRNVMERILDLRFQKSTKSVEAVIIHLDEYQLYIRDDERGDHHRTWSIARDRFKEMLKQIGNLMRDPKSSDRDFFILPICTGTSAMDLHFLPSEYHRMIVLLKPLTYNSAREMFLDKFEYSRQQDSALMTRIRDNVESHLGRAVSANAVSRQSSSLCHHVLQQAHFNTALHDSGYIPRFLDFLLDKHYVKTDIDWGHDMFNSVQERYGTIRTMEDQGSWRSYQDIRTIISLAITRQVILRTFQLPSRATIGEVERDGLLFLSPEGDGLVITMPFVYLRVLNEALANSLQGRIFPSDLLLIPTVQRPWQWQDFEQLHGHYQKALTGSLLDLGQNICPLSAVFRGGAGSTTLLSRMVRLRRVDVYIEKERFLKTKTDSATQRTTVLCQDGIARKLTEGIYHCATGCALIDHRWALSSSNNAEKPYAIFMQDKHSHLTTTNPTIEQNELQEWYTATMSAVRRYAKKYNIVLIIFTVRRVTANDFSNMPNLITIDRNRIQDYLSPTFAQRGLVQAEVEEEEEVLTQPMDLS
ncbi:MAG: hypothetical protein J3Q66DRAFT_322432 [Benniella sp.]|nr:MAG: hypothetical protein J3Q66DRAFT_322432 [Benniella sp.]